MRDFVEKLELENYWSDEKKDPLIEKLDLLISKGEYKNV